LSADIINYELEQKIVLSIFAAALLLSHVKTGMLLKNEPAGRFLQNQVQHTQ
jgi:hypothetical protein